MIKGQMGLILGRVGGGCSESGIGEGGEGNHGRAKVELERSLGWLHLRLPRIAWEKCLEHLVDGG
jgi:hypothetical protein